MIHRSAPVPAVRHRAAGVGFDGFLMGFEVERPIVIHPMLHKHCLGERSTTWSFWPMLSRPYRPYLVLDIECEWVHT